MADPGELAAAKKAAVVAAAGFGKTELIARAVAQSDGVQFILTHTHAGVDALRRRLNRLGVSASRYRLGTVAGFCLRYASSYPTTSGLAEPVPLTNEQWKGTYAACTRLLRTSLGADVLSASCDGVFVDEYQDCTTSQHEVVLRLADLVPCRVLGDPLQGIFEFGEALVDWTEDVEAEFDLMQEPAVPWRWRTDDGNADLGDWLVRARGCLLAGAGIEFRDLPRDLRWVEKSNESPTRELRRAGNRSGSCVGILTIANRCHALARRTAPMFQVIEPLGCPDLLATAEALGQSVGAERVELVYETAKMCMTGVGAFKSARVAAARGGPHRLRTRLEQYAALAAVRESESLELVLAALKSIHDSNETKLYRRELLDALVRTIRLKLERPDLSLGDAAWVIRDRSRRVGRRLRRLSIGRPVLIKGLEFDHAVVLDADSLTRKQLYVALTRARGSLTVLSASRDVAPLS